MQTIHILFPVLNEENRIEKGITESVAFMEKHFNGRYKITIVDNGSTDNTEGLAHTLTRNNASVHYIKLDDRGVGFALRAGVAANDLDLVGYMDIDLSTKLEHILDVDKLFYDPSVQIVNGSRLSKGSIIIGRRIYRKVTSYGLRFLLKILLHMKIDDAICGFKFFRKDAINRLMPITHDSPGWFYCIELLIRAERNKVKIAEIPIIWEDEPNTTVHIFSTIKNYVYNILRLRAELKREGKRQ